MSKSTPAQKKQLSSLFFQEMDKFIKEVDEHFPNDRDVLYAKNGISAIRKTNPRLVIDSWLSYIYLPHSEYINECNLSFITNGNYEILNNVNGGEAVKQSLFRLREPISSLPEDKLKEVADIILKMSKLSFLYAS